MLRRFGEHLRLYASVASDGAIDPPDFDDQDTPAEIAKEQCRKFCEIMTKTTLTLTEIKAAIDHLNRLKAALALHEKQQTTIVINEEQQTPIADKELLKKSEKRLEIVKAQLTEPALKWATVSQSLHGKIWEKCTQSLPYGTRFFSTKKPLPSASGGIFLWGALPDDVLRNILFFLKVHEVAQVESVCKQWNSAGRDLYVPGISKIFGCLLHYNVANQAVKFNPKLLTVLETPPESQDSAEEKKPIRQQQSP